MSATSEDAVSAQSGEESPVAAAAPAIEEKPKKKYARRYSTRYEVFDAETALQTRGGLKKEDLMLSRTGKIVSKKKSLAAKALYTQYGFSKRSKPEPKPEEPKKSSKKKTKKTRKRKKKVKLN